MGETTGWCSERCMTQTSPGRMTDDEFVTAFEACTLRSEEFHHADHVRIAFIYLCRFPILQALQRFSESLMKFATTKGKPDLYHETITWAFLFLIRERAARYRQLNRRQPTWPEFARDNPDLLSWKGNILKRYYTEEILSSELARRMFVFPDRLDTAR